MRTTTRSSLAVVAAGVAAALICLHVVVGVVLITGFARVVLRPSPAADHWPSHG